MINGISSEVASFAARRGKMISILTGSFSFFLLLAADWAEAKTHPATSAICRSLAYVFCACAFLTILFFPIDPAPPPFASPFALRLVGALVALSSFVLLASSLFLELRGTRSSGRARSLVTDGSYALSRHPGVLWLFLLQSSLVLVSGSWLLLMALPVWTGANLLLVAIEDKVFFPRIFGQLYRSYQRTVPFLIPNRESAHGCLAKLARTWPMSKYFRRK